MKKHMQSLECLFEQLGLDSSEQEIEKFINKNAPIPATVELHKASFWSSSQSAFLLQSKEDDAEWAEIVDQLDTMLR